MGEALVSRLRGLGGTVPSVVSLAAFVAVWTWLARTIPGDGHLLPTPWAVVSTTRNDWDLIWYALSASLVTAGTGLLIGVAVAIVCALVAVVVRTLRRPLMRLLTIVFCLPLAAIAPLLFLLLDLPGPHVALAAISVLFPVYVPLAQGLTAHHDEWEDLRAVLGGTRRRYFLRVQVASSVRQMLVAARIAGPAAILGTTLAEYFGGDRGVGVLMINSLAQADAPRAYALGGIVTMVSVIAYVVVGIVSRILPWTAEPSHAD
jgi:ABC-type nitrate/sulfonate/bicarbonate transport system permease component